MKKILTFSVALVSCLFMATTTNAQAVKIGTFDEESLIELMPKFADVNAKLEAYVKDSLLPQRDMAIWEYKTKDSTLKADSAKMAPSLKKIMQQEIAKNYDLIVNWQQYQNQEVQRKQYQFLAPIREEIFKAYNEVVAAEKYTHVFKGESFAYGANSVPLCDNLTIKVAMRLKLKIPKEIEDAYKAAGCGGGASKSVTPAKPK